MNLSLLRVTIKQTNSLNCNEHSIYVKAGIIFIDNKKEKKEALSAGGPKWST